MSQLCDDCGEPLTTCLCEDNCKVCGEFVDDCICEDEDDEE